jgi:hypothetical protein
MPPKQTKKQTIDDKPVTPDSNDSIDSIQKEWATNVRDIISAREKLSLLEKRNEELISKLWEKMNKNPSDNHDKVVIEASKEEKKPIKPKKIEPKEENESENEAEVKPKAKATKTKKADVKPEVEKPKEEEKPIKKVVKKTESKTETKEVKEEPKKAPVKSKITAPSKGTPKPKAVEDEKPKQTIEEDSDSETDVDSLSSVSSESDASGGEDN